VEIGGRRLGPGLSIGYHRDLPGAFGERVIAHQSAVFGVPDELADDTAVLTEPLSIALHAVLGTRLDATEPVLVIGSGTIALATVWALRATGFTGEILSQTKRHHEARLAARLGASENVRPGGEARAALLRTGASAHKPIIGGEVFAGGGFPVIFDCVGNAGSLRQALRFAATRGRVVVLGCAAEIPRLDLSFLWARELRITGFVGYGMEDFHGHRRHTFQVAQQLLTESGDTVSQMVTHRFPLGEYKEALVAAASHRKSGAIKVLLEPEC
jgi:threonine dehydrogenase-like Zn-dependent dehydrogenase